MPRSAKVKYIVSDPSLVTGHFTYGKDYTAYYIEFWQGIRKGLVAKDDNGEIWDFNQLDQFEILEDPDYVLNDYVAIVECITHQYDDNAEDLNYGKRYKAIGCNEHRFYLVMDESYDCYWYPASCFTVIDDPHHLLQQGSIDTDSST